MICFMENQGDRPSTIHADEALAPKGPWKFIARAARGGFSFWGVQLILAWAAFQTLTSLSWTEHLGAKLGNSSLANNWGELLTARDLWEIMENGGLRHSPLGFWTTVIGIAAILWALWAGWKVQTEIVGVKASLASWLIAMPVALALGYLPLLALHASLWNTLAFLSGLGIQFLGWVNLFGGALLRMAFASALLLQWWLCRIDLAHQTPRNTQEWLAHLKDSALRLWTSPVQWGNIVIFGVAARVGLAYGVLFIAWEWGGQTLDLLWAFALLQAAAAAINAWIIGWTLRLTALYWKHDVEVRSEIRSLETSVKRKSG
jgi:hypothetical protein